MRLCKEYNKDLNWLILKLSGKRSAHNLLHKAAFSGEEAVGDEFLIHGIRRG